MKKSLLTFILIVCMLFSLTACSSETIEGKYWYAGKGYERKSDDYIEFFTDGTYEMCISWHSWWDENGKEHEICSGKYKIKRERNLKYIQFEFPSGLLEESPDMKDYILFIYSDTILSDYPDASIGNYVKE